MIVLIDGRSGAGKTTLAAWYGAELKLDVVHCDDFYPGWQGLAAAGSIIADQILQGAGYYTWDWAQGCPGSHVAVDVSGGLIIEGCGAITEATIAAAAKVGPVLTIYVTADEELRKQRALERDPDYAPYWQLWASQELAHVRTMPRADVTITVTR